jgi:hypothetical protein
MPARPKTPKPKPALFQCPDASQAYDQSVVMRLQNTMAVRDKYSNRYDRSSGSNVDLNITDKLR